MRTIGMIALVAGILWLLFAFNMDVSVPSMNGQRVNNLGLMADRQNSIFMSMFVTFCGLVCVIASGRSAVPAPASVNLSNPMAPITPLPDKYKTKQYHNITNYRCHDFVEKESGELDHNRVNQFCDICDQHIRVICETGGDENLAQRQIADAVQFIADGFETLMFRKFKTACVERMSWLR